MHNLRIVQELGFQLQQCARTRSLLQGKELHRQILSNGYGAHTFVANSLVQMYGSCQCLQEARSLFHSTRNRNIYSWTIFLAALAENGELDHAKIVFDRMPARNLASWNVFIAACARNDQPRDALEIFYRMILEGERPDSLTFVSAVDSCGILKSLREGKLLHEEILDAGLVHHTAVANTLITMYGKCQHLGNAWSVFAAIPDPDVVSWTSIATAFARNGYFDQSLELFQEMPVPKNLVCWSAIITAAARCDRHRAAFQLFQAMDLEGVRPNSLIYLTLLQGCHSITTIRVIHCTAEEARDSNPAVMNATLSAYGRYGELARSWAVFLRMLIRDPISWNSIATACAQSGDFDGSMRALERMPQWEISSWNIGIAVIARGGATLAAISFSSRMNLEGIKPDGATYIALIDSCASPNSLPDARRIASWISESEFWSHPRLRDATIDMFGRCDDLDTARAMFFENPTSAAGWAKMIVNCAQNGDSRAAIDLFKQMDLEGVKPIPLAFLGAIAACSNSAALGEGEAIHACFEQELQEPQQETEHGPSTAMVHNALIHMYGRCGSLGRADSLFRSLRRQSVVSWTSIIRAFASNGRVDLGFHLFREMLLQGTPPTAVTMAELQSACAHLGLLRDGLTSLASMLPDHGIAPTAENYACIADLFRRSNAQADEEP